jgi:hypothetical protein
MRPIRIANFAGMFGDRPSAAREQLDGGPIDVLTGEYLAELTMLIMARVRQRHVGYARTFIPLVEEILGECLDRGVKIVVNAGGLDAVGCADAVDEVAAKLGLAPSVAAITGDDLVGRLAELQAAGHALGHLDTGELLGDRAKEILTANVYLGGWGITEALNRGADIVITGRVTDASLTSGPAAWWHGWARDDWDRLAGAVVGGHIIECGCQATGGNYSFFDEVADMTHPGFPWVDIHDDGSVVVGKHDNTGGEVSRGTVTSQLLYEISGARYLNPDVTVRFDSIGIEEIAKDRVRLSGIKGEPPPATLKVAVGYAGGFKNSFQIGLTGPNQAAKADLVQRQVWDACEFTQDDFEAVSTSIIGAGAHDPTTNDAAVSWLRISVADRDPDKVGRVFADTLIHTALGSIPGMFGAWPPGPGKPFARYWPAVIDREAIHEVLRLGGEEVPVAQTDPGEWFEADVPFMEIAESENGDTVPAPLGDVVGARAGDKGGHANLGIFPRNDAAYPWLRSFLTTAKLRELLPEVADLDITRDEFPRLRAVHFFIKGLLDEGVSSTLRLDAQAKGLGEWLRSRVVDIPRHHLE